MPYRKYFLLKSRFDNFSDGFLEKYELGNRDFTIDSYYKIGFKQKLEMADRTILIKIHTQSR